METPKYIRAWDFVCMAMAMVLVMALCVVMQWQMVFRNRIAI